MGRQELIERERRWRLPAAIAAIAAALLYVGASLGQQAVLGDVADNNSAQLTSFAAHSSDLMLLTIPVALGFGLFAVPLLHLFRAGAARSERVRQGLIGLVVAGPVFLALGLVLSAIAINDVAGTFVEAKAGAKDPEQLADDLIRDSSLAQLGGGLKFAGTLGLCVALLYTSLWGMRTGLLTRFLGSLGMAVAVSLILLGPFGPFATMLWFIAFGMMALRESTLPPAWGAGVAVPWPTPGQAAAEDLDPDILDGEATEVSAEAEAAPPAVGSLEEEAGQGEQASGPRRKRKRRR